MKRIVVLMAAVFLFFPGIVCADDLTPSVPKAKIEKPELKTQQRIEPGQKTTGPDSSKIRKKIDPGKKPVRPSPGIQNEVPAGVKPVGAKPNLKRTEPDRKFLYPAVEIQGMEFRTESNGRWKVSYMVENTGQKNLEANTVLYKSFQILKNGTRVPEHAVTVGGPFTVGSVGGPTQYLDRCPNAKKLMLEVFYKGRKLDQKTVNLPGVRVKIKNWILNKDGKTYKVTLQNSTQHTLKVALRMVYESSHTRTQPDTDIVVPANSTKTHTGIAQRGKKLKSVQVLYKSNKQCSGKNYLVLDSKSVQTELKVHGEVSVQQMQGPPTSQKNNIQSAPGAGPAVIESMRWWRSTQRWEVTIRNVSNQPVYISVARRYTAPAGGYTVYQRVLFKRELQAGSTKVVGEDLHGIHIKEGANLQVRVKWSPSYESAEENSDTNFLHLD